MSWGARSWFEVDRNGLRQLMAHRDKSYVIRELVQNAVDEPGITEVDIQIAPVPGKPHARVVVRDDAPEGFYDLRHAYTLYAKTRKRPDPEKRGRFNLGEKQVLAIAKHALIRTTTGQVLFSEDGKRHEYRTTIDADHRTERGSMIDLTIPATRAEMQTMIEAAKAFILPAGIKVTVNDTIVTRPTAVETIEATLTTEYEDAEGQWKRTQRKTSVEVYEPKDGQAPMLYELGLPVVELEGGDPWHLNVMQRVPLNSDRDNVSPAFIRDLRAEVLNKLAENLTEDQAAESWVSDATDDERVEPEAVRQVVKKRFGENAVVADPNDPQSKERAIMAGCTIVPARAMSKATWDNVRAAGAVPSSSQVFGSIPTGSTPLSEGQITAEMHVVAEMAKRIYHKVFGGMLDVTFCRSAADTSATFARGDVPTVRFNVQRLGKSWFKPEYIDAQVRLIVHEIAHRDGGHLERNYIEALCSIASTLFKESREEMLGDINELA